MRGSGSGSSELAPDTPVESEGTPAEYLSARRKLSMPEVEEKLARVTAVAASVGLDRADVRRSLGQSE